MRVLRAGRLTLLLCALACLLAALPALLAACGGEGPAASPAPVAGGTGAPGAPAATGDESSPAAGGTLTVGLFPWVPRLRQFGVMLEVCPLSNKALRFVPDPRLHPAKGFLRRGLPIVLGSDDPAIFGTVGLTDDFWTAYVAWRLDLRTLKQMALDSILRSSLPADRRERQLDLFERRWQRFIRGVIEEDREAAAGTALPQALPDAA